MTICIVTLKVTAQLDLEVDSDDMLYLGEILHESIDEPFRVRGKTIGGDLWIETHEITAFDSRDD